VIVLDASVLIGYLDGADAHHERAAALPAHEVDRQPRDIRADSGRADSARRGDTATTGRGGGDTWRHRGAHRTHLATSEEPTWHRAPAQGVEVDLRQR
jgi:hypothetical protein